MGKDEDKLHPPVNIHQVFPGQFILPVMPKSMGPHMRKVIGDIRHFRDFFIRPSRRKVLRYIDLMKINHFFEFLATLEKGEFLWPNLDSFTGLRISAGISPVILYVEGAQSSYLNSITTNEGIRHFIKK